MWEIYDKLINGIPEDWKAEEVVRGSSYCYVKSNNGLGIAELSRYDYRMPMFTKNIEGSSLRELAVCVKSWNFYEAAVGLAAINAYYNNIEVARKAGVTIGDSMHVEDRIYDPFIMSQNEIRGKKVTVLGHFPHITTLLAPICEMKIIAGEIPQDDDYPVTAVEYLLPESDFVFIGSLSLIDKTFPRLLELSKNAQKVTVVGPSTTLAPLLFDYGVRDLSGFIVKNFDKATRMIKGAENGKIFSTGQKVSFKNTRIR
ncbi:MAG: DUF364 domain-containing protein [Candidatus Riflebacteria bacterium]|nr:DUF364 domain-containing protein [Candidatus Riflebacteria bacterium]